MAFSEPLTKKINAIIVKSETKRSALIPVLREIQNEHGYLSAESMEEAANMLEISPSSVQNVATFYTMFFTEPAGKHVVWVCRTLSCALGGQSMWSIICATSSALRQARPRRMGKSPLWKPSVLPHAAPRP